MQKIAMLKRLLEQSSEITNRTSTDAVFKTWKNTVERTLIRVYGRESPEVKQFSELNFYYRSLIMNLDADYSYEHHQAFERDFSVAISSIKNYVEELEAFPSEVSAGTALAPAGAIGRVFISHSSRDVHYVEEIIELLEAVGLLPERIFCTSFEGYGISLGENFLETIRQELASDSLVLFVLSHNFYASPHCMCEMGAVWVQTKEHIPILVPPFDYKDIQGVIPLTQGFKINEPLKWNLFREKVQELLCLDNRSSLSSWERKRAKVIKRIDAKIAEDKLKPVEEVDDPGA